MRVGPWRVTADFCNKIRTNSTCQPFVHHRLPSQFCSPASTRATWLTIALACTVIVASTGIGMWTTAARIEPPARLMPEKAISAARLAGLNSIVMSSADI